MSMCILMRASRWILWPFLPSFLPPFLPCHQNERQPCPPCPMLHASFASISVSPLSLHELEIRVSAVTWSRTSNTEPHVLGMISVYIERIKDCFAFVRLHVVVAVDFVSLLLFFVSFVWFGFFSFQFSLHELEIRVSAVTWSRTNNTEPHVLT